MSLAYDGVTFSSYVFILEEVKDGRGKHNGPSCFYIQKPDVSFINLPLEDLETFIDRE
jgi:hypothetical protein